MKAICPKAGFLGALWNAFAHWQVSRLLLFFAILAQTHADCCDCPANPRSLNLAVLVSKHRCELG